MRSAHCSWRLRLVTLLVSGCAALTCADPPPADLTDAGADREDGATRPPCEVDAPTRCPSPQPTYADVKPIFEERCVVCHYGAVNGPWPLVDYSHVSDWRDEIRTVMLDCSMPPADELEYMLDSERLAILTWIRCGLPK